MSFPWSYSYLGLVPGLILTVVVAGIVLYTSLIVWEFCLRHPEVLRTDRHRTLLEGLADGLAAGADDGITRAGAQVIHRELHRLTLLRTARNALVQG